MNIFKAVLIGIVTGVASGLLGIGGAIIMVPCMVYFLGIPQHNAHATSLAVIIPGAVFGSLVYGSYGQLDLKLAALFALGGMVGAYIGSSLMTKVKPVVLRRIFAVFALLLALRMGVQL